MRFCGAAALSGLLAGCAGTSASKPASRLTTTAEPTADELPQNYSVERVIPIRTGIVGQADHRPTPRYLPEFREPRPTPAEQAILDRAYPPADPRDTIDFLAFYRPAPTPEKGVSPEPFRLTVGEVGRAGAFSGAAPDSRRYGLNLDLAAARIAEDPFHRQMSALLPGWTLKPLGVGPRADVLTGEDNPRHIAGKHQRVDE